MTTPARMAAALMAGGRSTRMGQDKAFLPDAEGREWWRGRLALLQQLAPAELLISCRADQAFPENCGARLVFDQWEDAGPMGGIVSALEAMTADRLLVLAVDLPGMSPDILEALVAAAGTGGAVFRRAGHLEPLAGLYPRTMALSGRRRLASGDRALRGWIAEAGDLMRIVDVPPAWERAFVNVNDAGAWERWRAGPDHPAGRQPPAKKS